jgi:Arm DNA-binding domain
MPQRLLTDRFCAGAKPREGEAQTDFFDAQVSGLALRVSEGRKSWTFHYTFGGTRKRLTFGAYPSLSLASARTHADEAKTAIAAGHASSHAISRSMSIISHLTNAQPKWLTLAHSLSVHHLRHSHVADRRSPGD